ncbi:hypothetical protein SAMN05421846_108120 [Chryseobacterium taeanense]|uniref:Uncharacterized protein n=1 Tax=Chryseobacterium taeanense TaxID=311334 RepID=A0A1G8KYL1_9FLAO|nr:hypothetical protein [Chryseobacterium taeanense]SDI48514.1 hypothetical protein SAMN05421846_108120 [Chryseobacterium taeanense]
MQTYLNSLMKKNLKTLLTKGNLIALNFLGMIFLSTLLSSCQKNKYPWEPGISASRYYPITDVVVDFGNAGNGTRMPFDSGWRQLTFQLLIVSGYLIFLFLYNSLL